MSGGDRLSDLTEDLLASIVSFLPARDAARAAAISRQWRSLWLRYLRTDSLNIDSGSYGGPGQVGDLSWLYAGRGLDGIEMNHRLFADACAFLVAPGRCGRLRKLSLTVKGPDKQYFEHVMGHSRWGRDRRCHDLMACLLGAPELRHVEELCVRFEVVTERRVPEEDKLMHWIYRLDPAVLPGHTLRVLDLVFCRLELEPPDSPPGDGGDSGDVFFPCLSVLRLYKCSSSTQDLEGLVRASPSLLSMRIEDHNFCRSDDDSSSYHFSLRSASLIDLTLVVRSSYNLLGIELDAPCLRTFKYHGLILTDFSMKSHSTNFSHVDLTVEWMQDENRKLVPLHYAQVWRFLGRFRHAKAIRLKVQNIRCIAVDEDVEHEHLVVLPGLERLELEGSADSGRRKDPDRKGDEATAIANLLRCCPVIRDLRIRILTEPYLRYYATESSVVSLSDFDVSMDLFRKRFSKETMVPLILDRDHGSSQAADIPGLTGCRFDCLENHLKKVTLRFEFKDMNSFEVRLAKFFAENCMVLDVLQIDDGKKNFLSHISWTVERWRANAAEQRNQMGREESPDSSKQRGKRKGDCGVELTKRNYRKRRFATYTSCGSTHFES